MHYSADLLLEAGITAETRIDVLHDVEYLEASLVELSEGVLQDSGMPAWIQSPGARISGNEARRKAAEFIRQMDYIDGMDPAQTCRMIGLLGASRATLEAAEKANWAARQLQARLQRLDRVTLEVETGEEDKDRWPLSRILLTLIGRGRFNRRQAARQWVLLEDRPASVTYIHCRCKKIARTNVEAVRQKLESRLSRSLDTQKNLILADILRIDRLDPGEPLALVRNASPHPRANLLYGGNGVTYRKQVMANGPLFFPAEPGDRLPVIRPLPEAPALRLGRTDRLIEPEAFLPTLGAHRYIPGKAQLTH